MDISEKNQTSNNQYLYITLGVIVAVLVFTAVIFYINRNKSIGVVSPLVNTITGQDTLPTTPKKTVQNPITGELYTEEESKDWITLRPLAVMVNNYVDARPQSGLIYADIIYEVVAEGGITRFIAFFLSKTPEKVGPIRSTREYYLVLVKELGDAMLMHIGWSPQALEAIETWPVRSLGRGGVDCSGEKYGTDDVCWRENPRNVAVEHTAFASAVELRTHADNLGWSGNTPIQSWKFKEEKTGYTQEAIATKISVDFWYKGDYSAIWEYDPASNSYKRYMGYDSTDSPIPHVDQETSEQISVKNVIVQFADEISIAGDEKNRLDYTLEGSGTGLIFLDGKVIKATWSKAARDARTIYYDTIGKEIEFNRGKFWVSIVASRNVDQVLYN